MKRDRKPTKRSVPVFRLTLGALYVALFALAGNVPVLAAIQVAGIPVTLQVFLIAMMGLTLGVRGGLTAYGAVLVLTLCGLPMMAGGRGGAAVLLGPTCGYIYGWVFLLVLLGLYADRGMPRLLHKKLRGMSIHLPGFLRGGAGRAGAGLSVRQRGPSGRQRPDAGRDAGAAAVQPGVSARGSHQAGAGLLFLPVPICQAGVQPDDARRLKRPRRERKF